MALAASAIAYLVFASRFALCLFLSRVVRERAGDVGVIQASSPTPWSLARARSWVAVSGNQPWCALGRSLDLRIFVMRGWDQPRMPRRSAMRCQDSCCVLVSRRGVRLGNSSSSHVHTPRPHGAVRRTSRPALLRVLSHRRAGIAADWISITRGLPWFTAVLALFLAFASGH